METRNEANNDFNETIGALNEITLWGQTPHKNSYVVLKIRRVQRKIISQAAN
jgi:hypothetical protein